MTGPQFFETRTGRAFYDGHVPRLVKALERIATALEELLAQASNEEEAAGP